MVEAPGARAQHEEYSTLGPAALLPTNCTLIVEVRQLCTFEVVSPGPYCENRTFVGPSHGVGAAAIDASVATGPVMADAAAGAPIIPSSITAPPNSAIVFFLSFMRLPPEKDQLERTYGRADVDLLLSPLRGTALGRRARASVATIAEREHGC